MLEKLLQALSITILLCILTGMTSPRTAPTPVAQELTSARQP
jgi:hypothetical protein